MKKLALVVILACSACKSPEPAACAVDAGAAETAVDIADDATPAADVAAVATPVDATSTEQ